MKTVLLAGAATLALGCSNGERGRPASDSSRSDPAQSTATAGGQVQLKRPSGFTATVFAENLGSTRHLAAGPGGTIYANTWHSPYDTTRRVPAGGYLVAQTINMFAPSYAPVDAVDRISSRPDFDVALYPGHLAIRGRLFTMNPDIRVTSRTPPTLLIQAEDDPVDPVENSVVYHAALRKAGVPVEMHLYTKGGHAFGLRRTTFPITEWPQLAEQWLAEIGVIPK